MKKIILFMILGIFFLSSVSALIITPNLMQVNKTIGQSQLVNFQILNNQNITMYNLTFSNSNILNLPKIAQLTPGQIANVTASVNSETQGIYNLNLQGFYFNDIGSSNNIYQIEVQSSNPTLSECDKTITYGDTMKWHSTVLDQVVLYNAQTGVPVDGGTIGTNQTFSSILPVGTLQYYFKRNGFLFTSTCSITVQNTTGLVNNPQYDGILQVDLKPNFPPTTISNSILTTSYTMAFSDITEGIMSITNTGNQVANVQLTGDWITFTSDNLNPYNFNLNPGITKGLTYKINPIVFTTSETNKTYNKNITISGNFVTQVIPLSIKINYADLSGNSSNLGNQSLDDYLKNYFCPNFPQYCSNPVVYKYVQNASGQEVTVNATKESLDGSIKASYDTKDAVQTKVNELSGGFYDLQQNFSEISSLILGVNQTFTEKQKNDIAFKDNIIFFLSLVVILGAGVVGFFHFRKVRKDKLKEENARY